jgi:hypothetical protein
MKVLRECVSGFHGMKPLGLTSLPLLTISGAKPLGYGAQPGQ